MHLHLKVNYLIICFCSSLNMYLGNTTVTSIRIKEKQQLQITNMHKTKGLIKSAILEIL